MISKRAEQAISHLTSRGLPLHTATGIVAGLIGESGRGLDTNAVGDKGKAYGIGQWHPDRQANFARAMGRNIRGSSLTDQLDFVLWEMRNTEGKAGNHVMAADNPAAVAAAFTRHYERPQDIPGESAKRARIANQLSGVVGSSTSGYQRGGSQPSLADMWAERRNAGNAPAGGQKSLADMWQERKAGQQANAPAGSQPSLADMWAERKASRMTTAAPNRGMDAFVADAAQAMADKTAPEQPGMMRQFAGGAGMGIADTVAGLDNINSVLSRLNPLSRLPMVGDIQQASHDAVQGAYWQLQDAYMQGGYNTPTGTAGRVAGNVASTAPIPVGAATRAMIPAAAGGIGQGVGVGAGVAGVAGAGAGVGAVADLAKGYLPPWLRWLPAVNIASKVAPQAGNVAGAVAPTAVNGLLYTPQRKGLLD